MKEFLSLAMSATAAAVIAGLLEALVPQGGAKRAVSLCGGILIMLALLRPIGGLFAPKATWAADVLTETERNEILANGQEIVKQIIEERTGAYIVNKSDKLGLNCTVEVTCKGDGFFPEPWSVIIRCKAPEHARNALKTMLEDELGIPASRQTYVEV